VQHRTDTIEHAVDGRTRLHIGMRSWRSQDLIVGRDDGKALVKPCVEIRDLKHQSCLHRRGTDVGQPGRAVRPGKHRPSIGWWFALWFKVGSRHDRRCFAVDAIGRAVQQTDLPTSTDQPDARF
jgi:hypothetical protein